MDALEVILHVVGGAALAAALWFGGAWAILPVVLLFGIAREQAQHHDEGWFGWINLHRIIEALAWGLGALLFVCVAMTLRRLA